MQITHELKAYTEIQGLELSEAENMLHFVGPFMGKDVVLVSYIKGRDGTFAFHSSGTCDDEIKEELPARIKSPEHLKQIVDFIAQGIYGDFPREMEFKAENWIHDKVVLKQTSPMDFEVQGYEFKIGEIKVQAPFEDELFESTQVFSLGHDKLDGEPSYSVQRDLKPGKYSDDLFHASEGDISRTGKSVHEVIAKIVAMCY